MVEAEPVSAQNIKWQSDELFVIDNDFCAPFPDEFIHAIRRIKYLPDGGPSGARELQPGPYAGAFAVGFKGIAGFLLEAITRIEPVDYQ